MKTWADKIADQQKKQKYIRKWQRRIKKTNLSREQWCKSHGIDSAQMSKWLNYKIQPDWDNVWRVENALKNDGV